MEQGEARGQVNGFAVGCVVAFDVDDHRVGAGGRSCDEVDGTASSAVIDEAPTNVGRGDEFHGGAG